jgi:hypothetical protein
MLGFVSLYYLLPAAKKSASVPTDRVYGLLGVVSRSIRDSTVMDYCLPLEKIQADFVRRNLPTDYRFEILSQVAGSRADLTKGLPSWCPNWVRVRE